MHVSWESQGNGGVAFILRNAKMRLKNAEGVQRPRVGDIIEVETCAFEDIEILPWTSGAGNTIVTNFLGSPVPIRLDLTQSASDGWDPMSEVQCSVACRLIEQIVLAPLDIVPAVDTKHAQLSTLAFDYVASLLLDTDQKDVSTFIPHSNGGATDMPAIRQASAALMKAVSPGLRNYVHLLPSKGPFTVHRAAKLCLNSTFES